VSRSEIRAQRSRFIHIAPLSSLDCQMCRVFFLATGAGALALLLGWTVAGDAAILFGLLALWLAAQFSAAPCIDEEPCDE